MKNSLKQDKLIYGRYYYLWRNGVYIGVGMFINNCNVGDVNGDAFAKEAIYYDKKWINIFYPDEWELIKK